ncbi:glycosyltransferase family 4 protein [Thermodesulfobacteriota bacterium]
MKFLFLCKRRPQGKDILTRPYGRFYYLPKVLAEKGHEVHILLFSYKNDPKILLQKDGIHWTSLSILKHGPYAYLKEAKKIINQIKPDWIVGFSDTYYGILAQRLGSKFHIPSLVDAYDNYESYIPWLKPLHYHWRSSLAKATLVTTAGPSLADLVGKSRPGKPTEIIPMAADPIFQPMDKIDCRNRLGLPVRKKLIGYSGSTIDSSRGINFLFEAFESLKQEHPDSELVLSGRKGSGVALPPDANWLGYIPDADVPLLMNSLDVLVVMNQPSSFGNYSYPVKLYEAMQCEIPVVVSETLSTKWIMQNNQVLLVEPDYVGKLCKKIKATLRLQRVHYGNQMDWYKVGDKLEKLLLDHQA